MTTTQFTPVQDPTLGSPLTRFGWALADGLTVARRDLIHTMRQPFALFGNVAFPIMILLMFTYLMGGAMQVPGGGSYADFLIPGMFVMTMAFGIEQTILAMSRDADTGVMDRFRSIPMSGAAVVLGRAISDMTSSVISLAAMIAAGLAVGWRPLGAPAQTAAAIGLLILLRFAILWLGIYIGLVVRGQSGVTFAQMLVWPVGFLSSIFVAPATMPGWLGTIAEWNPLSATASATRELFGNPGWQSETWMGDNGILMAIVWPLAIIAICFPLSVKAFRGLSR